MSDVSLNVQHCLLVWLCPTEALDVVSERLRTESLWRQCITSGGNAGAAGHCADAPAVMLLGLQKDFGGMVSIAHNHTHSSPLFCRVENSLTAVWYHVLRTSMMMLIWVCMCVSIHELIVWPKPTLQSIAFVVSDVCYNGRVPYKTPSSLRTVDRSMYLHRRTLCVELRKYLGVDLHN